MIWLRGFAIFVLIAACQRGFAHQAKSGKVMATAGVFAQKLHTDGFYKGFEPTFHPGLALLAEGDINDYGGIEVGLFYFNKYYLKELAGNFIVEKIPRAYITMGYRVWFFENLSAAVSFFSAYSAGEVEVVHNALFSGYDFKTTARSMEYGFDFSIQQEVWSIEKMAIILDARFSRSLNSLEGQKADYYGLLIGIKHHIEVRKM